MESKSLLPRLACAGALLLAIAAVAVFTSALPARAPWASAPISGCFLTARYWDGNVLCNAQAACPINTGACKRRSWPDPVTGYTLQYCDCDQNPVQDPRLTSDCAIYVAKNSGVFVDRYCSVQVCVNTSSCDPVPDPNEPTKLMCKCAQ